MILDQARTRYAKALDLMGPHRGSCGLCGGPDARHRIADSVTSYIRAGEPVGSVADEFFLSDDTVTEITIASLALELEQRKARIPQREWFTGAPS